jgi:hypothetical protein
MSQTSSAISDTSARMPSAVRALMDMASPKERAWVLVTTNAEVLQDMHLAERALRLAGQQARVGQALLKAPDKIHGAMLESLQAAGQEETTLGDMMASLEQAMLAPDYHWLATALLEEPVRLNRLWDDLKKRVQNMDEGTIHMLGDALMSAPVNQTRN